MPFRTKCPCSAQELSAGAAAGSVSGWLAGGGRLAGQPSHALVAGLDAGAPSRGQGQQAACAGIVPGRAGQRPFLLRISTTLRPEKAM
jgi:hypothetical protein